MQIGPKLLVELFTPEDLARHVRTFSPEAYEPDYQGVVFVRDAQLVVECREPALATHLERAIAARKDETGRMQLPGHHTSKTTSSGLRLNKRYPGEFVGPEHPRFLEAVRRRLNFLGESAESDRYHGKVIHLRLDRGGDAHEMPQAEQ